MTQLPDLMTATEVAEAARVSDETVRRWARTGVLTAIKLPYGQPRFRRVDVEDLLRAYPDPETPDARCPVCGGSAEITPSGAMTCRRSGSEHFRTEPAAR